MYPQSCPLWMARGLLPTSPDRCPPLPLRCGDALSSTGAHRAPGFLGRRAGWLRRGGSLELGVSSPLRLCHLPSDGAAPLLSRLAGARANERRRRATQVAAAARSAVASACPTRICPL